MPLPRSRRSQLLAGLGWVVVTPLAATLFTQTFGDGSANRAIVIAQTLLPYAAPFALPIAVAALATRRRWLAAVSAVVATGTAVLAAPLVWHPDPFTLDATVDADAPTLTVTFANVYWQTSTPALAADALLDTGSDVLVFNEFTPAVAEALDALGGADAYPYRAGAAERTPDALAIWSRFPLVDVSREPIGPTAGLEATVTVGERRLRVITAHPDPPFEEDRADDWVPSLRALNERAHAGASAGGSDSAGDSAGDTAGPMPTLVVADVNAGWWHPPYRRVLAEGLTDVHRVLGEGWSTSWPTDRWLIPAFTRLDHALITGNLQPIAIDDLPVPGSDHEGFTLRLALGR